MMKTLFQTSHVRAILILLVILFGQSCKKEEPQPEIPYVYVNFTVNPNSTEYLELNSVNGWVTVYGGYQGIILFRSTIYDFMAFERACPNDPTEPGARITVDTSGTTAYCPVCKSKYILIDGSVYDGPSHWPLKQYGTTYDGSLLYVYN
jgi:hypothetical protein